MNPFTFQVPSNILFESGASKKVAELAAGFGAQPFNHIRRKLDAVHRNAFCRQRERNAPRADGKFERPPSFRYLRQKRRGGRFVPAQTIVVFCRHPRAKASRRVKSFHPLAPFVSFLEPTHFRARTN